MKATGLVCGCDFQVKAVENSSVLIELKKSLNGYKSTFDIERAQAETKNQEFSNPLKSYTVVTKLLIPAGATVHLDRKFGLPYYGQDGRMGADPLHHSKLRTNVAQVLENRGIGVNANPLPQKAASWFACVASTSNAQDRPVDVLRPNCPSLYEIGKLVRSDFSDNGICAKGIHFFSLEKQAQDY